MPLTVSAKTTVGSPAARVSQTLIFVPPPYWIGATARSAASSRADVVDEAGGDDVSVDARPGDDASDDEEGHVRKQSRRAFEPLETETIGNLRAGRDEDRGRTLGQPEPSAALRPASGLDRGELLGVRPVGHLDDAIGRDSEALHERVPIVRAHREDEIGASQPLLLQAPHPR